MKKECSYEYMCEKDYDGQVAICQKSLEDVVADKLLLDKLRFEINRLDSSDRYIINSLFWGGKSEREVSAKIGVSQKTVNNRKKRILERLKENLENF